MPSLTEIVAYPQATNQKSTYPLPVELDDTQTMTLLGRNMKDKPLQVASAKGSHITFSNGHVLNDTTCGAAVACIGYGNERVKAAMVAQIDKFSYANSLFFSTQVGEELANELIAGTGGKMSKAYVVCSGSEAVEAALKLARQYYMETQPPQPQRVNFIAREGSYHGTTLGALAVGGHKARRSLFEPILAQNVGKVSACNVYRGKKTGETDSEYVERLAQELDDKFMEMGPETVIGFIAEPVVGAALGCVPAVKGYFKAMKAVCDKYGALLILDEIMSGMGRCGSLHAWQQEGVVPDIQTLAKGLGGGYCPIAAVLLGNKVVDCLAAGSGTFSHGQTYQGFPVSCAASLEVQRIIREEKLVDNVREQGIYLGKVMHEVLDSHPHVGDVRGQGLFWGIEFVKDKNSKEPFARALNVANAVNKKGLGPGYAISLYPGMGSADGILGDHVILSPWYRTTNEEIDEIVGLARKTIDDTFVELCAGCKAGSCQ